MTTTSAPLKLVRVVWEDASVIDDGTWVSRLEAAPPEAVIFNDLGWLLELTSEHVILSASIGKTLMGPRLRIPSGMVKSITEFKLAAGKPIAIPKKRRVSKK